MLKEPVPEYACITCQDKKWILWRDQQGYEYGIPCICNFEVYKGEDIRVWEEAALRELEAGRMKRKEI